MSWEYRVVRQKIEIPFLNTVENRLEIMEVYYYKNGNYRGYGEASAPYGETTEEIQECLNLMQKALLKPIIDMSEIK